MSYQPPTASASQSASQSGAGAGAGASNPFQRPSQDEFQQMYYICGDCGTKFPLKRGDVIRCIECGCRVLYKERTKR